MIVAWYLYSLLGISAHTAQVDDPWADEVIEYTATDPVPGFTDSTDALGAPFGLGPSVPANDDNTVSIGTPSGDPRGRLVLKFDTPVTNDPLNPGGYDFIVFSNAFWVGGAPERRFQEPGAVEISNDGVNWFLIPGSRSLMKSGGELPLISEPDGDNNLGTGNELLLAGHITNPNQLLGGDPNDEYNWGYADLSPTLEPYLDNYVRPDNPLTVGTDAGTGGGDAFDIAWAMDAAGQPVGLTQFQYIRISPFVERSMSGLGLASPEITAVADIAPEVDTDNDGILDDFELRVSQTDPARPESTILPLQIPTFEGGSPADTVLGTALHARGHTLILISDGPRTQTDHTAVIDLIPGIPASHPLSTAAYQLSEIDLEVLSSVPDFLNAELRPARVVIAYRPTQIDDLDELSLEPFRLAGNAYNQNGLSNFAVDTAANTVTFDVNAAGTFALAAPSGIGDTGLSTVWVDFAYGGHEQGTQTHPYSTLADAVAGAATGAVLRFQTGTTTETLDAFTPIRLQAENGPVRIGVDGGGTRSSTEISQTGFISRK